MKMLMTDITSNRVLFWTAGSWHLMHKSVEMSLSALTALADIPRVWLLPELFVFPGTGSLLFWFLWLRVRVTVRVLITDSLLLSGCTIFIYGKRYSSHSLQSIRSPWLNEPWAFRGHGWLGLPSYKGIGSKISWETIRYKQTIWINRFGSIF